MFKRISAILLACAVTAGTALPAMAGEASDTCADGHDWGEWETVAEASDGQDGLRVRECLKCGEDAEASIHMETVALAVGEAFSISWNPDDVGDVEISASDGAEEILYGTFVSGVTMDPDGTVHSSGVRYDYTATAEGSCAITETFTDTGEQVIYAVTVSGYTSGDGDGTTRQTADRSALRSEVEQSAALVHDDYSEESWARFETALLNARTVLADEDATQEETDLALDALVEARHALVQAVADETGAGGAGTGTGTADGSEAGSADTGSNGTEEQTDTEEGMVRETQAFVEENAAADDGTDGAVGDASGTMTGLSDGYGDTDGTDACDSGSGEYCAGIVQTGESGIPYALAVIGCAAAAGAIIAAARKRKAA